MNKIFKTKYDITTGQTKVVSELAKNCQSASSVAKSPQCGVGGYAEVRWFFWAFSKKIFNDKKVLALSLLASILMLSTTNSYGLDSSEKKALVELLKTGIGGKGNIEVEKTMSDCGFSSSVGSSGHTHGGLGVQTSLSCNSPAINIKLKDGIDEKINKAAGLSELFSRGSTETAPSSAGVFVDKGTLTIRWNNAGAGTGKQVINVGSVGHESLLKNVAAGKVDHNSTDAVNGGQLYSVIEAFGKLGTNVLGAQLWGDGEGGDRFGSSTFKVVEYSGAKSSNAGKTTFREAIEDTITAINQGMTFKVGGNGSGNSNNNTIKRQLGQSLTFKGDEYLTLSTESSSGGSNGKDTIKLGVNVATSIDGVTGNSGGSRL